MKSPFTFGFLSTIDNPLLPFFIDAAQGHGCTNIVVICDSKLISEKDFRIWRERTGGFFEKNYADRMNIYKVGTGTVPFYFVDSHNSPQTVELIDRLHIDSLFNAGTPRKLAPSLISHMKHGIVNVHPGVLPGYRGSCCVEWAILNDDPAGNSAHFIDEGYDSGPIIATENYNFPKDADHIAIRVKVFQEGCRFAGEVLSRVQNARLRPSDVKPQLADAGKYWKPTSDDDMQRLHQKLSQHAYKYQSL